jgi:hypothetical protein
MAQKFSKFPLSSGHTLLFFIDNSQTADSSPPLPLILHRRCEYCVWHLLCNGHLEMQEDKYVHILIEAPRHLNKSMSGWDDAG